MFGFILSRQKAFVVTFDKTKYEYYVVIEYSWAGGSG